MNLGEKMKLQPMPSDPVKAQETPTLERVLLDRVLKIRKITKEMKNDPHINKAEDALMLAKLPFKKAKSKWKAEIEAIELELKSRGVKFDIKWDDIYEED